MYKFGPVQQKLLLLLVGGLALGMETSSIRYYRKLRLLRNEWKKVDQRNFNRSVRRLSAQKLVKEVRLSDGSFKLVLTKEGIRQARAQYLFGESICFRHLKKWDKKWRIVMFDIPERDRKFRNVLREHLHRLKFHKLQHSVFISPLPCEKQISELTTLYGAGKFVRIVTADRVDNQANLKKYFFKPKKKDKNHAS